MALFCVTQTKAIFGDGSTFECDVIVACTGYKNTFPFVEETHPDINEYGQNPRLLYKQVRVVEGSDTRVLKSWFSRCLVVLGGVGRRTSGRSVSAASAGGGN